MTGRTRAATVALALALAGCSEQYEVEIVTGETAARDEGLGWELSILRGGCDPEAIAGESGDTERIVRMLTWRSGEAPPEAGSLSPGRYGFQARVLDADCTVRWAGCAEIEAEAGGSGTVTIRLADVDGPACDSLACSGEQSCESDGLCRTVPGTEVDCDDGIDCTVDSCTEPAECSSEPDDSACPEDQICDREAGCLHGGSCGDGDADRDGDGYPCSIDCDDEDPDVSPGASETCNDRDDDCDDEIDEGDSCGDDCIEQALGETTFVVCTEPRTWPEARLACEDQQAVLGSSVIDEATLELARQFGGVFGDQFWIGPNDREQEGQWRDADGEPLVATQWAQDQPDGGETHDCAFFSLDAGGWFDGNCDELRPSVCER